MASRKKVTYTTKDGETFMKERKKSMNVAYNIIKPSINYDKEYDILMIYFSGGKGCESTIELTDDLRIDVNKKGIIVGIEICDFSKYQKKGSFK